MKRWILLIVLVVGLSAAGTVAVQYLPGHVASGSLSVIPVGTSASKKAQPKVVLTEETTYEFGTLPQRTTGKHAWKVKNEGKGDLELWMESSTCSCTLAKFKNGAKDVLKPGESTEIVLEFETRESSGEYEKGATIGTNDPNLPSFPLHVHGKVYPAVMTFPAEPVIALSTISNDVDDHKVNFAVFSKDRPETKVVKVETSNPNLVTEHAAMTPEELKSLPSELAVEGGEKVTVNVKSGLPLGNFREEVVVTTDHPKQPEVRMTLTGKMLGPINFLPAALLMHDAHGASGDKGELMMVVRNNRATRFEVEKKPEALQVQIVPPAEDDKSGRYRLVVTIPPGTPPERIEGEIVLKTDHPKADRVIVPVSIWVLQAG